MSRSDRIAIVGIGHPLRRDDAAGLRACERMRPWFEARDDVLVIPAGPAPENCIGALRAFAPQRVILLDAARMGRPPGSVRRIVPSERESLSASTHTLPLPAFCDYLGDTLGCRVDLVGIEPADTSLGEDLTPVVEQAVERLARRAAAALGGRDSTVSATKERDR